MRKGLFSLIVILMVVFLLNRADAAENKESWLTFPYTEKTDTSWDYLYVVGGYHSEDSGTPAWGSADYQNVRMIGDSMGDLEIKFSDGTTVAIPLVFGYTMWFRTNWLAGGAPFKTADVDFEMANLLKSSLYIKGGFEGDKKCVFRVKLEKKSIDSIKIIDNSKKAGNPIFDGAYLVSGEQKSVLKGGTLTVDTSDNFYDTHTIAMDDSYPSSVQESINKICNRLYTNKQDFENAVAFTYPTGYTGPKIAYSGTNLAEIASGVVYTNVKSIFDRVEADGLLPESYTDSPSWMYDGFGAWIPKSGSYHTALYTRNRGINALLGYGYVDLANSVVNYANKWMMYFPENNLTIKGVKIPGHFTVIANDPLVYSKVLTKSGWPTVYTKEKFGDDYENLGNQETDGHGLMMISNYSVWKNSKKSPEWVQNNWTYINEAAQWILWCFDNPTISFAKKGTLYAESEGGMKNYTLFCNMPCYLGMVGYAEMAESIGKTAEATAWRECAEIMRTSINLNFVKDNAWKLTKVGFYHDPTLGMLSDIYGYDLSTMPSDWITNSKNTYKEDIASVANTDYFGVSGGLGYNHCNMAQNALLLDQMADATKLMNNLTKLCYAPRLIEPFMAPESASVDLTTGVIRRQGDLGNLYQLSEAIRSYQMTIGISQVMDSTLKLMPRLVENWNVDIANMHVQNTDAKIDMAVTYPKDGCQMAIVELDNTEGIETVKYRFGPLPMDTEFCTVQIDGQTADTELFVSGDSKWAWVNLAAKANETQRLALVFSPNETLPGWPSKWPEQKFKIDIVTDNAANKNLIISITTCTIVIVAALSVVRVIIKRRKVV